MTQIVSNMVSLLQGCGILATPPPPSQHSALYPLLTDDMFPLDLLQQALVSLLAPNTAAFHTLFGLLVQHCQQEAASTKLVSPKFQSPLLSLSKLMDVKTSLGSCPVAVANLLVSSDHW